MKSVQCEPEVPIARRKAPAWVRYPGPHGAEYHTAAVEGVVERADHRVWFSWGSGPGSRAPARSTDDPSPSRLVRQLRPNRVSTRRGEWLSIHRCVRAGFPTRLETRTKESNVRASQAVLRLSRRSSGKKQYGRLIPGPPCSPVRAPGLATEFERVMLGPEKRRAMLEQAEARRNLGGRPPQY
jgi:hypothetical protein